MSDIDVRTKPGAFRAARRPYEVGVEFAGTDGELDTWEGPVRYRAGDALLTGLEGERWPVPREQFFASYAPVAPLQPGANGTYRRHNGTVWVWRTDMALDLLLSGDRGSLHANAGDFVVQFDSGDKAVMPERVFERGYSRLPAKD
jgi:hypothetical protein